MQAILARHAILVCDSQSSPQYCSLSPSKPGAVGQTSVCGGLQPNAASFSQTWDSCSNGGADPLVRAGRPRPALLSKNQALPEAGKTARGPAADAGGGHQRVARGRPPPAFLSKNQALPEAGRPARGPAADEGVRPTIYADARLS